MEYTRGGGRRARPGGRQARQRHGEPCQSTMHHPSTHAHGRADVSRTGYEYAGAELRTRCVARRWRQWGHAEADRVGPHAGRAQGHAGPTRRDMGEARQGGRAVGAAPWSGHGRTKAAPGWGAREAEPGAPRPGLAARHGRRGRAAMAGARRGTGDGAGKRRAGGARRGHATAGRG
jgi:hypothetical protein